MPDRRVLYVLPEVTYDSPNARRTRAEQLLPALAAHVDLTLLFFGSPAGQAPSVNRIEYATPANGVTDRAKGTLSLAPRIFARYDTPGAIAKLAGLIDRVKPDIIHLDSLGTVALLHHALRLVNGGRTRVVLHTHDSITLSGARRAQSVSISPRKLDLWIQMLKIRRVERDVYPRAALCLVDSPEDAAYLRSLNPATNVGVLPLGFNGDVFRPDGPRAHLSQPSVVFSGSMRSMQSVDAAAYLIREIMPAVWHAVPDAMVYLVGAGADERILELQRGNENRVVVTGFVDDLASYLRAATVYVSPLRLGSGMRTRVVEAAATGCAIVSSPEGVQGVSVTGELPWRIASDARSFGAAITSFLQNPAERDDFARRARAAVVQRYSWNSVASNLAAEYDKLLGSNG
jgi:polysaccharide biosynthesis protein PslH